MAHSRKSPKPIEQYAHKGKKRANNPQAGLVTPKTDPDQGRQKYQYDPHLDPQLQWAGKAERTSFEVPTVSLHVHERIDPKTIINSAGKQANGEHPGLFEKSKPLREAVDFYKHKDDWSNRFVTGDSLLVMNSLLQKESMGGKVQMVYIDPPYGVKYRSNFQPFVDQREVGDGDKDEDLTREPEMIKAFRDTWELGIHSYLSYMRDRLLLARELLADSGSVFVQIGDENVHRVGMALDDIFSPDNRVATISYATTGSSPTKTLPQVCDYLLWYAKDKKQAKYHHLYEALNRAETVDFFSSYAMVEEADGKERLLTKEERQDPDAHLPQGARLFARMPLTAQGTSTRSVPYEWNGQIYKCPINCSWRISKEDMDHLADAGRLVASGGTLRWKRYEDEVPGRLINNMWKENTSASNKRYVVETATKAIQRCMLMSTDPGDLVLDITCGSGTSAYVAEQWGRRWITCDTSRVALALAKQRLMTAAFDYYKLADDAAGIGNGFKYKTNATVSAKTLAEGTDTKVVLYDQPLKDSKRSRVTGPFTVEAVPAPLVRSFDEVDLDQEGKESTEPPSADRSVARSGETLRQADWRDDLLKAGIRGKGGQHIHFGSIEPLAGTRHLHAEAVTRPDGADADGVREPSIAHQSQRAVIVFGPEHAPMEPRQVESAIDEAEHLRPKPAIIIFAAFQFDPEAAKDIDETNWEGVTLLKVQMNADLLTDDLQKRSSDSESFWLVGQPDVELKQLRSGPNAGKWQVVLHGFDYFDTESGELISGGEDDIAAWMLDTDYDGRSLYPRQVFFPMAGDGLKDGWNRLAQTLRAEINEDLIEYYRGLQSIPFEMGEHERVAVKIIDRRGIESLRIMPLYK